MEVSISLYVRVREALGQASSKSASFELPTAKVNAPCSAAHERVKTASVTDGVMADL